MARARVDLQLLLETITEHVYFQPPTNFSLAYPCIIYGRDADSKQHADNAPYVRTIRYQVTVIDRDPDSLIPQMVSDLPLCSFDRHFTANNLNHDVFNLYY